MRKVLKKAISLILAVAIMVPGAGTVRAAETETQFAENEESFVQSYEAETGTDENEEVSSLNDNTLEPVASGDASLIHKPRKNTNGGETVTTWDCIWFGNYWQEDTNGDGHCYSEDYTSGSTTYKADSKQPIKWRVLDIDGSGNALLLADKLIDIVQYNETNTNVTWETCTMRSYLNGYDASNNVCNIDFSKNSGNRNFLYSAFNDPEINCLIKGEVKNPNNPVIGTARGNTTYDWLFCLSLDEAMNGDYGFIKNKFTNPSDEKTQWYTDADPTRVAVTTKFTDDKPSYYTNPAGTSDSWWLRSPGSNSNYASYVSISGAAHADSYSVTYILNCVRPAFRMNLSSSSSLWTYAGTVSSDGTEKEKKKIQEKHWILDDVTGYPKSYSIDGVLIKNKTEYLTFEQNGIVFMGNWHFDENGIVCTGVEAEKGAFFNDNPNNGYPYGIELDYAEMINTLSEKSASEVLGGYSFASVFVDDISDMVGFIDSLTNFMDEVKAMFKTNIKWVSGEVDINSFQDWCAQVAYYYMNDEKACSGIVADILEKKYDTGTGWPKEDYKVVKADESFIKDGLKRGTKQILESDYNQMESKRNSEDYKALLSGTDNIDRDKIAGNIVDTMFSVLDLVPEYMEAFTDYSKNIEYLNSIEIYVGKDSALGSTINRVKRDYEDKAAQAIIDTFITSINEVGGWVALMENTEYENKLPSFKNNSEEFGTEVLVMALDVGGFQFKKAQKILDYINEHDDRLHTTDKIVNSSYLLAETIKALKDVESDLKKGPVTYSKVAAYYNLFYLATELTKLQYSNMQTYYSSFSDTTSKAKAEFLANEIEKLDNISAFSYKDYTADVFAEWTDTPEGRKYTYTNNICPNEVWKTVDGEKYYFKRGYVVTGWQDIDDNTYYFSKGDKKSHADELPQGAVVTGFVTIEGFEYYFDPNKNGVMAKNRFVGKKWFGNDGKRDVSKEYHEYSPEPYVLPGNGNKCIINCPVDVFVKNSMSEIVASIADGVAFDNITDDQVFVWVDENNQKKVFYPHNENYSLKIMATGEGELNYTISEVSSMSEECGKTGFFQNINIQEGDELYTIDEEKKDYLGNTYYVHNLYLNDRVEEMTRATDVLTYYNISAVSSDDSRGIASGGGMIEDGGFVLLNAVPNDGFEFSCWLDENRNEVSNESSARIPVLGDAKYIAQFIVPIDESIKLKSDETDITLLPGETRRLSVSPTGRYIYGVKWDVAFPDAASKNCISVKNGVVTAKKAGTAEVTASYGSSKVEFYITVDGSAPKGKTVSDGKKTYKLTAPKTVNAKVGEKKKVSIGIPANMRNGNADISVEAVDVSSVGSSGSTSEGVEEDSGESYPAEHSVLIDDYRDSSTGEPPVAFDGDIRASGSVDGEQALLPAKAAGLNVETHTPQEIRDFISAHPSDEEEISTWSESPSSKYPYKLGRISDTTRTSALNMLNTVRYIAGLNADVTSDDEYEKLAQAATLADAAFGMLSHYPEKVDDMDQDLYDLGARGASSCNLGWSYSSSGPDPMLNNTILHGWTGDSDSSNIDVVGHRRWVLSPWMSKTGFGVTIGPYKPADYDESVYTAMYAFDTDDKKFKDVRELLVAWPAQNTPVEYFSEERYVNYASAWSLSTGRMQDIDKVRVTLVRRSDNKTWSFSKEKADGFFNVDNNNYGQPGCVIFRPDGISRFKAGEVFDVSITGLNPSDVSYTVNFFSAASTQPVTGVSLPSQQSVKVGKTITLTPEISPSNATNQKVTWKSSVPSVASISTDGTVTGIKAGMSIITVTTNDGGYEASCTVTVTDSTSTEVKVTGVELNPPQNTVAAGKTTKLSPIIKPSNATNQKVTWKSSVPSVASISTDGTVTGIKAGMSIITVTTNDGGYEASCTVTVTDSTSTEVNVTGVELYPTQKTIAAGKTTKLSPIIKPSNATNQKVTWKSSVPSVASISTDGTVTGIKAGTTRVTVTTDDGGFEAYCDITVKETVDNLTTENLKIKWLDYNNFDRTKATKGFFEIEALDVGTTYVVWTMTDENGKEVSAVTKVIVKKPITELHIAEKETSPLTLNAGEGKRLTVTGTKGNTDSKDLSFSVKGKGVKVSKSGYVVATTPGSEATVTVKAGKVSDSIRVSVPSAEKYLSLNKTSANIKIPKTTATKNSTVALKLTNPKKKEDQPNVTWSVAGDPEGITVFNGVVSVGSYANPGCYTVTATPEDASSGYNPACCELIVK